MKKQFKTKQLIVILWAILFCNNTFAQQEICYPLTNSFEANLANQPSLQVLSNSQNQTGNFQTITSNNNLCNSGGEMEIFHFEENAGLKFDNVDGFLDSVYTIEMVFKLENFPGGFDFSPWIKILGFANDDTGFFFYKTPFVGNIVFEFWNNTAELGDGNCSIGFFNETDFSKLTIVRNASGLVEIYVNCTFMCSYDDSVTNLFFPKTTTGNQVIFFQDDPAIIADEASSGFVKNIKIANFAKTSTEILASCDCLCEELTSCEMVFESLSFSCDPLETGIESDTLLSSCSCDCDSIFINEIQLQSSDTTFLEDTTCDPESSGTFIQNLQNISGCDSIVILNVLLLESPTLLDSLVINDSGNSNGSISINVTGGLAPYEYLWSNGGNSFSNINLAAGIYSVTVTDQNGCELTLSFEVEMMNALSEIPSSNFHFFPNPIHTGEGFSLHLEHTKINFLEIELFDGSGHLLEKTDLLIEAGSANYFFKQHLSAGIYFIKITDKEGRSGAKKIIVVD